MKEIVVVLSVLSGIGVGLCAVAYYIFSPDIPINTPNQVRQIVIEKMPQEYDLESVESIRRMSEFEGEHRPMKWLVLRLKNKIIADENEMIKITKPVCLGLLGNNTGYEGIDIIPSTTLGGGANCGIWGP